MRNAAGALLGADVFQVDQGAAGGGGSLMQLSGSPALKVDDSGSGSQPTINPTLNTDFTCIEFHSNVSSTVSLDNNTPQTGTSGTAVPGGTVIFNRHTADRAGQGRLYGTLVINRALTGGGASSLKTYFANLYGGTL